ncbi:hypothetical protein QC761_0077400 [Podospora bellae-mahoneyi]|uniref:Uncharacterized protein n=1 Tax=Podospora bellae-mahoneyi TaxID=2093777 RepID=A0ABR0FCS3_9PEZI|nr:hypothetical protein QC761_0077400 [Podospora bellae-mahoneyi]
MLTLKSLNGYRTDSESRSSRDIPKCLAEVVRWRGKGKGKAKQFQLCRRQVLADPTAAIGPKRVARLHPRGVLIGQTDPKVF